MLDQNLAAHAEASDAEAVFALAQAYYRGNGVEKDDYKAASLEIQAADLGLIKAMNPAACTYYEGKHGYCADKTKALEYWRMGSDAGDPSCLYELGLRYELGIDVERDILQAIVLYEQAAQNGKDIALSRLGDIYHRGKFIKKDDQKAITYYERAYARGSIAAAYQLGRIYENSEQVPHDLKKAFDYYKFAAEHDDLDGMLELARFYLNGFGTDVSFGDAREWNNKAKQLWSNDISLQNNESYIKAFQAFERIEAALEASYLRSLQPKYTVDDLIKAAEEGNADAATLLAVKYTEGDEVPKNERKANYYWVKAVDNGANDPEVLYRAGVAHLFGEGVPMIYSSARMCLLRSNTPAANLRLAYIYYKGLGCSVNYSECEQRLRKVMNGDDPELALIATHDLGYYLYHGPHSWAGARLGEAVNLLRKAADQGLAEAQLNLGIACLEGKGTPASLNTAVHYLELAAKQGNDDASKLLFDIRSSNANPYMPPEEQKRKRHPIRGALIGYALGMLVGMILGDMVAPALFPISAIAGVIIGIMKG